MTKCPQDQVFQKRNIKKKKFQKTKCSDPHLNENSRNIFKIINFFLKTP